MLTFPDYVRTPREVTTLGRVLASNEVIISDVVTEVERSCASENCEGNVDVSG